MATKAPPTIRTSQVRKCVPRGRQKSVGKLYSSDACESCIEAGRVGQGSSSAVRGDKKRKLEDRSTISDSESPDRKYHKSVRAVSHFSSDLLSQVSIQRETRSLTQSISKLIKSTQDTADNKENKSSDYCGICTGRSDRKSWKNLVKEGPEIWVRCEFRSCRVWHHLSCVFVLILRDSKSLVYCPTPNRDFSIFICPRCLDQSKKGYDKAISQGIEALINTIEKKKNQVVSVEEPKAGCIIAKAQPQIPNAIEEAKKGSGSIDGAIMEYESAREEKYNGFDTAIVNDLMRHLHQYIYDYNIEVRSVVERHATVSDIWAQHPLKEWKVIDVNGRVGAGQPWFHMDDFRGKQSSVHAPITAALRCMLGTSEGKVLEIPSKLKNLTFSQVHIGLVSWFVFDVLENRIDLYGLPKMKEVNATMTAVLSAGEAKWPTKGRHLLREVRLRTWHKSEFQKNLLSNRDVFILKLESFLEPLTKDIDKIQLPSSEGLANIIDVVLPLWAYLQSLHGRLIIIQPSIGSIFDPNIHEAYDQDGLQHFPQKTSKKKILWILCRGFRYEEEAVEDVRILTVKARVVLQK